MFLRFSRFRFKDGKEAEGLAILRRHVAAISSAGGCRDAWLGQGQHPATECVVVALFETRIRCGAWKDGFAPIRSKGAISSHSFPLQRIRPKSPATRFSNGLECPPSLSAPTYILARERSCDG